MSSRSALPYVTCLLLCPLSLSAATASPLFARGYAVMPEPQRVSLQGSDFPFSSAWRLSVGQGVSESSSAVESLSTDLKERHQITFDARSGAGAVLELTVVP